MRRLWHDLLFLGLLSAFVQAWTVEKRDTKPVVKPAPLGIPISQWWEGDDWSSFALQLSGPQKTQNIRVFPATSIGTIWPISTLGCPAWFVGGRSECEKRRGGLYDMNVSQSYTELAVYGVKDMQIVGSYGMDNLSLDFGYETVTLGYQKSGAQPVVPHTLISQMASWEFSMVGLFGLDPRPTNFSDHTAMNGPQPSFIQKLKDNNTIPSLSYGYTAGAKYRNSFASLTLGGYDSLRTTNNSKATFPFYDDIETPLMVTLSSIGLYNESIKSDEIPLNDIAIRIDSARPFIYLPPLICQKIADDFALTYNNSGGQSYYFVNDKSFQMLQSSNRALQFNINAIGNKSQQVSITLPYSALVQNLDYPYVANRTKYVPLRPATDAKQYVLGRTFLQEAYLSVDYERSKFSVYQAAFPPTGATPHLVAIRSLNDTDTTSTQNPIPKAAIAGIAVGIAVLIALLIVLLLLLRRIKERRRREAAEVEAEAEAAAKESDLQSPNSLSDAVDMKVTELDSGTIHEVGEGTYVPPQEMGYPETPAVGEMPDESTLTSTYGGFFKEVEAEGGRPIIKVYYEMDATPPPSEQGTPTGTLSSSGTTSSGTTLIGSSSLTQMQADMLSPIPQTPAEFYERRPPPGPGDLSPIPQTPLEFYGTNATAGRQGQRGWIGRAPGPVQPRVVLTPATPLSPDEREVERSRWLKGDPRQNRNRSEERDKEKDGKGKG